MTSNLFDIAGHTALVTGASSGLGRVVAGALADAGAKVVGVARRSSELAAWCEETEGQTAWLCADLSNSAAVQEVALKASEPFGPPDILINAAGINTRKHADDVGQDDWNLTLNLNLSAPFFLAQALVPGMKKKGWGRIISFASLQSLRAFPNGISYGASKAGLAQLTRAMAQAWSRYGINANALAPGFFATELTGPVFDNPQLVADNAAQTCIGRNGELDDIVGPALFLSSPASNYVTGQLLFVDGGFTAK